MENYTTCKCKCEQIQGKLGIQMMQGFMLWHDKWRTKWASESCKLTYKVMLWHNKKGYIAWKNPWKIQICKGEGGRMHRRCGEQESHGHAHTHLSLAAKQALQFHAEALLEIGNKYSRLVLYSAMDCWSKNPFPWHPRKERLCRTLTTARSSSHLHHLLPPWNLMPLQASPSKLGLQWRILEQDSLSPTNDPVSFAWLHQVYPIGPDRPSHRWSPETTLEVVDCNSSSTQQ